MEAQQHEVRTRFTKYIFLDVVQFTNNRSVEAQSHIVEQLNKIVRDAISKNGIMASDCILLPTGDGICIGIINSDVYDIHIQLSLIILELLNEYNTSTIDQMRQFQLRIGINQNVDNVVIDINGNENLAGTGINTAARVMSAAEANQILVGQSVFDMLQQREKYMNKFDKRFLKVKHDLPLTAYQYVGEGHVGLNIAPPSAIVPAGEQESKMPKKVAYYFAHAIRNREFLLKNQGRMGERAEALVVLLWFLALDSFGEANAPETDPYIHITYGAGTETLEAQLDYYYKQDFRVRANLARRIINDDLSKYLKWLSHGADSSYYYFVNAPGLGTLKREFPDIWEQFELSKWI